jgi:hypothetical protein
MPVTTTSPTADQSCMYATHPRCCGEGSKVQESTFRPISMYNESFTLQTGNTLYRLE